MKNLIIIIGMIFAMSNNVFAEESDILMEFYRKSNPDRGLEINRAPMRNIPIDVYYNDDSHTINIYCDSAILGEVYLYLDESQVDYSSDINTSFQVAATGLYKIEIIGETWTAIGYIQL